ncbi:Hypothetical protein FKW44_008493 [Caligus rogercresseyi]|uniref:Uncharacterized protein n=1 Tax=Caligus rogercresseyi TaxID=217165 RepID=A0A7T8KGD6_CALRO|nr:Hypothetical protein FKW44_008493 [Caligus rogercresseyi]
MLTKSSSPSCSTSLIPLDRPSFFLEGLEGADSILPQKCFRCVFYPLCCLFIAQRG